MVTPQESYVSTFDFIHLCRDTPKQRLKKLSEELRIDESAFDPYKKDYEFHPEARRKNP